jgi:outer membrane protein TolC
MHRVTSAYWKLWLVQRVREVRIDQEKLLQQLSASARVRLEVGQGSLADVSQIDLKLSRMSDSLAGLDEAERQARAELVRSLGVEHPMQTPLTQDPPRLLEPSEDPAELLSAAQAHPRIRSLEQMARAAGEQANSADADSLPSFTLGADYIVTGEALAPNVPDSGKDAVIVMLSMKLPLWQGVYGDEVDEARAREAALSARQASGRNDARAALTTALSEVADSARRAKLYERTLLPQAQGALGSVLGGYQSGQSTVSAVLLAQNELLELQLGLVRAHTEHGIAWAKLESIVGRPVRAKEVP